MTLQAGVQPAECGQFRYGEITGARQHGIEQGGEVAVGQEEEVLFPSVGIERCGSVVHDFVEQADHEFRGTE